ncbi:20461_t:CDS:1 [Funneliformis geosporum]|uniref:16498_t:CDS:1 n=1 Tax=Funneliformis geosporum TaxID=1117311 RepID=A0A9W4SWB0_9GLOM|nr:20461_t:CDS:1 [Funneliformis geosporum]CAI2183830.1 16498_t:CDS:1 [Funneliformis geosporum]
MFNYRTNRNEIIKKSSEAYYGKERGKAMEEVMSEDFYTEPEHQLLSYIPSYQKEFSEEDQVRVFVLINTKYSILKGFRECKMKRESQEELKSYLLRLESYKEEARDNYHKY